MMSVKYVVSLLAVALIGFSITPSYSTELVSCNGFESCPTNDGDAILALTARIAALEALLADVSRGTDPNTGQETLTFSGMNVQVVDGTGNTDGPPTGTGNVIIGYNELRGGSLDARTGSHMLVIGRRNNYISYGGMVVGYENSASGDYASVSGGADNIASGQHASVSGGQNNTASGNWSSVSGGASNTASGGAGTGFSGGYASVSGGSLNIASGNYASISGGYGNTASYNGASVSGGQSNEAYGERSSVSGGNGRTAVATSCWEGGATVDC